jgi:hypothetical protein
MKIDEADINHNAVCLIHKALKEYELYYDHPEENVKAMTLFAGRVIGVLEMVNAMKEVLRA